MYIAILAVWFVERMKFLLLLNSQSWEELSSLI